MRVFATAVIVLVLTAPAAWAGQSMVASEIETAFRGITLDGVYNDGTFFSETYFDDGTIRYHDTGGADVGEWSVEDDMFCTFYEEQQGACFFVVRDGRNCFTFYEPVRAPDGKLVPRDLWTSRGWDRRNGATCAQPPEAVI